MTSQNGRAFNEWLRAQLKAKKMSQRQLALQSGVDHSTISRLIRGDRMPSLGTATKLARGLREIRDDAEAPHYLGLVGGGTQNPTARVEYALRADDALVESQVRQIMEYYLSIRMRRLGRPFQSDPAMRNESSMRSDSTMRAEAAVRSEAVRSEPFVRAVGYRGSVAAGGTRVSNLSPVVGTISRPGGRPPDRY